MAASHATQDATHNPPPLSWTCLHSFHKLFICILWRRNSKVPHSHTMNSCQKLISPFHWICRGLNNFGCLIAPAAQEANRNQSSALAVDQAGERQPKCFSMLISLASGNTPSSVSIVCLFITSVYIKHQLLFRLLVVSFIKCRSAFSIFVWARRWNEI